MDLKPHSDNYCSKIDLQEKLIQVATEPGVYVMKDAEAKAIYIGKARNLKKRLASYFSRYASNHGQLDLKTEVLIKKTADFETIITGTEKEALILESNLIKRYKPRYNVILKDDKRYPSLRLDMAQEYPNLTVVRKVKKDGALYFGPFPSASAVNQTLKVIHKNFKLRKCKTKTFAQRTRPCLNHQMGFCLAPCCLEVDTGKYKEIVAEVILFLNGRTPDLIKKIEEEMRSAAEKQAYEKAAALRDKMFALKKTLEKQVAVTNDFVDRDVLAAVRSAEFSLITILFIRGGFLLGTRNFNFSETIATEAEMIASFMRQYYEKTPFIPKEILVPTLPEDVDLLEELLSDYKGQKVRIRRPQRGPKVQLLNMASRNAANNLKKLTDSAACNQEMLVRLQRRLRLKRLPKRIECVDTSSLSGTDAVAAVVVFENAVPQKTLYRKYKIKTVAFQDDYAYIAEILKRRFRKNAQPKPYADLLMIDGGKGQLNMAVSAIKQLNLDDKFEIISIAKKIEKKGQTHDKIYKPGQANPVNLGRGEGDLLLFLQRIRDEAHRFAISFHRQQRSQAMLRSALDAIPGVGKERKKALFKHFKSIKKIQGATIEELCSLPGISRRVAENIQKALST